MSSIYIGEGLRIYTMVKSVESAVIGCLIGVSAGFYEVNSTKDIVDCEEKYDGLARLRSLREKVVIVLVIAVTRCHNLRARRMCWEIKLGSK